MVLGVATGHWATGMTTQWWILLLAVISVAAAFFLFFRKGALPTALASTVILIFFAFGGLRSHWSDPIYDATHWTHSETLSSEHPSFLTLKLRETPVPRERSWRVTTEVETIDRHPCHGQLRLYLRQDNATAALRYGDRLLVHGYVDPKKGTLYTTSDHYLVIDHDSTSLRAHCERLRMSLLQRMHEGPLDHRHQGVAAALVLGWRGDLEPNLQQQFRDAGIMHLLCVSGLHVGLLAIIVSALMFWIGKERRGRIVRGIIQLATLWAFAALSGLAPATVRAALMFSLFAVSHIMGCRTDNLNLLAAVVLIMLSVDPLLLFDLGWQLSFSAVLGILLMRPAISLSHNILWRSAIVSLAATLATLPVCLAHFHQVQPYFLIANIVIVPLAGLLLGLSLLYMALPCVATAFLAFYPLHFCDWLTHSISQLPGIVITFETLPSGLLAAITLIIIILFITINILLLRYQSTKDKPSC